MCQGITNATDDGQDQWYLDNSAIRSFIDAVQGIRERESDPNRVIEQIEPAFKALLA